MAAMPLQACGSCEGEMSLHQEPRAGANPDWQRRVIAFADLVESVRLLQHHETDVIERWRRFIGESRGRIVPQHQGRVVRTAGDALLLDFPTVPRALACAFDLNRELAAYNSGRAPDQAMVLRIGIHPAEVLLDIDEAFGAGVNLAARLAGLAQPGRVVVSAEAREQVVDGLHGWLRDLGLRYVKHVDEPVRAFEVQPLGLHAAPQARLPRTSDQDLRPAVAVVPFAALPPDPAYAAVGHALADDVIGALVLHPGLRVLSRLSTAALQDAVVDPATAHRLLGASYLLSGRYYVTAERVRLNVELCSLPDGQVQWTGSASTTVDAIFAGQDELVPHIVSNVGRQVLAHELQRVKALPVDTLASYSLFIGASGLMNSLERGTFGRAREVFEHLIDRHPRQAAPYAKLAHWYVFKSVQGWSEDAAADSAVALDLARRATDMDTGQAIALASEGLVRMNFHHDAAGARRLYEAAIAANPSEPHAWGNKTAVHSFTGEHDAACDSAQRALAVSPLDPMRFLFEAWAAMATLGAGRFDDAARHARASVRLNAVHHPAMHMLIAALWLAGRHDEARASATRYLELRPEARVSTRPLPVSGPQPVWGGEYHRALRAAGIPG